MGKIISNVFISLDGVVESPERWHFPYFTDQMGEIISTGAEKAGAFLMGRTLYEEWAAYWPPSTDEPFASFINNIPKYVVSNTLTEATWNNTTIVSGDVAAELTRVKAATDGDIIISGSPTLVRSLLETKVLDRLELLQHPIVVGHGHRLFEDVPTQPLKLVYNNALDSGVPAPGVRAGQQLN